MRVLPRVSLDDAGERDVVSDAHVVPKVLEAKGRPHGQVHGDNKSFKSVELGRLQDALDELHEVAHRDFLGGEARPEDVAVGFVFVVAVADDPVECAELVRTLPDVLVVVEVADGEVVHPSEELARLFNNRLLVLLFLQSRLAFLDDLVEPRVVLLLHWLFVALLLLDVLDELRLTAVGHVGDRLLSGEFPAGLPEFGSEVVHDPLLGPLVVENELVHVIADVPEQVLGLGEARLVVDHHSWAGKQVVVLLVVQDNGAAVL